MLMRKLQYFGHLMRRPKSLEKTLMLGKTEGQRRRGQGWDGWMPSLTWWTWVWVGSGSWRWTGRPGVLWSMESQRVGHDQVTELNWTSKVGFSSGSNSKRICLQCRRCRRHGCNSWVGKIPWRREWLPTPVLLPEKFHGQRSLMGYRSWDWKELRMTEQLTHTHLWLSFGLPSWH